jgi:quercetin dioxygenase-like cupin family protein
MRLSSMALATLVALLLSSTAPYAADAGRPIAMTPDQLKWAPNPASPEVMTATAWGDPATGPHGAFHKFKAGFTAPLHTHTATTHIVVLKGTMSVTGEDGKEMKFPAGSFFTQPNTYKHVTKCLPGSECEIYVEADAKWDIKPVAAK